MARTTEEILKGIIADYVVQIATLQSIVEQQRDKLQEGVTVEAVKVPESK